MPSRAVVSLCSALLPGALAGQAPVPLGKPTAEFPEPFTQITAVRELRDGRVIVVDQRESSVQLLDFRAGTSTRVGRLGAGPGEYGIPGRLIALPGDTTALHDPGNSRYLLIKPDGAVGETFRLSTRAASGLGGRGSVPRGSDARGRIFFEGGPFITVEGRGMVPADSAPVMRYDRATQKLDTLAFVQLSKGNATVTGGASGGISISVGANPFPDRDVWGAMPDGGISVARVRDYHVDRYSATGVRASGRPVRAELVAVGEAEKEAWRVERRRLIGRPRSGGGAASGTPLRDPAFPATMPPFVWAATFGRPNGELWVLRSHKARELPTYDVFANAMLIGRVSLPAQTSLIGFGNGTAYVIRRDADDLEYLQQYSIPSFVR